MFDFKYEHPDDWFLTWSTQFVPEDNMYYVRLDCMESGSCNTIWQLDYGRFDSYREAMDYVKTLPDPYEAAIKEAKVFEVSYRPRD